MPTEERQHTYLDAALNYRQRGWAVIDLDVGSKSPGRPGWQHERFDEGALRERLSGGPRNVSILFGEPSGGLVDVDLDCAEARSLADEFLPPTASVFGRPGSPRPTTRCSRTLRGTTKTGRRLWRSGAGASTLSCLRVCTRPGRSSPGSR